MIEILEKNEKKSEIDLQSLLNEKSLDRKKDDFLVLILKTTYKIDFYNQKMFGLCSIDYILGAVNGYETKIVDFDKNQDVIDVIKQNLNEKKYVLVLFSDTPLVTKNTINDITDYFLIKSLCALRFNRGYCFSTDYLKSVEKIYCPNEQNFCDEDFLIVKDSASFSECVEVLRNRIVKFHQSEGVLFLSPKNVSIDANATIGENVVVGEFVTIFGKSVIESGCKLFDCTLNKVIVGKNCEISNSIIENSVIEKNCKICDYSVIKNKTILENKTISNEKMEWIWL